MAWTREPLMPTQAPTGIDLPILRDHGDFRALARLADAAHDPDHAVVDLGHFHLEELHEQLGRRAREHDLRALRDLEHLDDDRADAVADGVALGARLLALRQDGLGPAEVDDDVALLEALDLPVEELADALLVLGRRCSRARPRGPSGR